MVMNSLTKKVKEEEEEEKRRVSETLPGQMCQQMCVGIRMESIRSPRRLHEPLCDEGKEAAHQGAAVQGGDHGLGGLLLLLRPLENGRHGGGAGLEHFGEAPDAVGRGALQDHVVAGEGVHDVEQAAVELCEVAHTGLVVSGQSCVLRGGGGGQAAAAAVVAQLVDFASSTAAATSRPLALVDVRLVVPIWASSTVPAAAHVADLPGVGALQIVVRGRALEGDDLLLLLGVGAVGRAVDEPVLLDHLVAAQQRLRRVGAGLGATVAGRLRLLLLLGGVAAAVLLPGTVDAQHGLVGGGRLEGNNSLQGNGADVAVVRRVLGQEDA
jgi:hypothetical protein